MCVKMKILISFSIKSINVCNVGMVSVGRLKPILSLNHQTKFIPHNRPIGLAHNVKGCDAVNWHTQSLTLRIFPIMFCQVA